MQLAGTTDYSTNPKADYSTQTVQMTPQIATSQIQHHHYPMWIHRSLKCLIKHYLVSIKDEYFQQ